MDSLELEKKLLAERETLQKSIKDGFEHCESMLDENEKYRLEKRKNRNTAYQKASDQRHRDLGRSGRKVWATPEEHEAIKHFLVVYRSTEDL